MESATFLDLLADTNKFVAGKTDACYDVFNDVINMSTFDDWEDPLIAHDRAKEVVEVQQKLDLPPNSPTEVMAGMPLTPPHLEKKRKRVLTGKAGSKRKLAIATATVAAPTDDGSATLPVAEGIVLESGVAIDADDAGDAGAHGADDDKRQRRMQRNRESAAESRKKKKQKVEMLEELITSLREQVESLREQNESLRLECAVAGVTDVVDECSAAAAGPSPLLPPPLCEPVGAVVNASGAA